MEAVDHGRAPCTPIEPHVGRRRFHGRARIKARRSGARAERLLPRRRCRPHDLRDLRHPRRTLDRCPPVGHRCGRCRSLGHRIALCGALAGPNGDRVAGDRGDGRRRSRCSRTRPRRNALRHRIRRHRMRGRCGRPRQQGDGRTGTHSAIDDRPGPRKRRSDRRLPVGNRPRPRRFRGVGRDHRALDFHRAACRGTHCLRPAVRAAGIPVAPRHRVGCP